MCRKAANQSINQLIKRSSQQYPAAAAAAEEKKSRKYSDIVSGVDFSPFAIETSGVWGKSLLCDLVTEIPSNSSCDT